MLSQFRKTKPQHVNNSQVHKVSVRLAPGGWSATVPLIWSPPGYLHRCIALMGSLVCKGPVPEDKPPSTYLPTYYRTLSFSSISLYWFPGCLYTPEGTYKFTTLVRTDIRTCVRVCVCVCSGPTALIVQYFFLIFCMKLCLHMNQMTTKKFGHFWP